jgi:hypothetical protein
LVVTDNGVNPVVNWTFNAEKDISSYQIYRGLSSLQGQPPPPSGYGNIGQVNRQTSTFTDVNLAIGGNWKRAYYKIKAVDNALRESAFSDTAGIDVAGFMKAPGSPVAEGSQASVHIQNYPNPFNNMSSFEFRVSKLSHVTLSVYNILGEEVTTIVSEHLSPGIYTGQWDATGQTSGVYFYRMQAGDFIQTKKLMLLR